MVAIQCKALTKSFKTADVETVALRGVDLEVLAGGFLSWAPPVVEKQHFFIIAGILAYFKCIVEGYDYQQMSTDELMEFRAKHLGFIFQSYNLIPTLSLAQNVAIPLIINGTPHDKAVKRAEQILAEGHLKDKMRSRPNQLSGGQQQRVAIARALVPQSLINL